jgi:hypothetical protein
MVARNRNDVGRHISATWFELVRHVTWVGPIRYVTWNGCGTSQGFGRVSTRIVARN